MTHIEKIAPSDPAFQPAGNAEALRAIRAILKPVVTSAAPGPDLTQRLGNHGFMLRRHSGQTFLATAPHGKLVCAFRDIAGTA